MKRFTRTIEDFTCDRCAARVTGNGYTNHCPRCLWSKHVDLFPGDRASPCGGAMLPESVAVNKGAYRILHTCTRCGLQKQQTAASEDNQTLLILLGARPQALS